MKFIFNRTYFILAVVLFIIEWLIGVYLHDAFIRPYFGDFLVVILIYCFVKAFLPARPLSTAIGVLIFSFAVEVSQYFGLVYRIGLGNNKVACMLMGTYFSPYDLLAYTLGIVFTLFVEWLFKQRSATVSI
jgi:hypothetical protein